MCVARFPVHQVPVASERLAAKTDADLQQALSTLGTPQAFSVPHTDSTIVEYFNNPSLFATAVYVAFYKHYPLKINPNVVWLTILQGFATYVSGNAEALRTKFVTHESKQTIEIERADFSYGSPHNDWPSVFPQYADEIRQRTNPGLVDLLQCDFSNTTPTDAACSHITLMSICQEYFRYSLLGGCGIPWVELLGTASDWERLREKAGGLVQFQAQAADAQADRPLRHFREWITSLLPVLDQFVSAAHGKVDLPFWGSVCNVMGDSGSLGAPMTGWITAFFPYLDEGSPMRCNRENFGIGNGWQNAYLLAKTVGVGRALELGVAKRAGRSFVGVPLDWLPCGLASAPVHMKWIDTGIEEDLEFYAGIFALHQHPDGALEPRTGWVVVKEKA